MSTVYSTVSTMFPRCFHDVPIYAGDRSTPTLPTVYPPPPSPPPPDRLNSALPFYPSPPAILYCTLIHYTAPYRTGQLLLPIDEWSQPTTNRTASTGMSGKVKRNWLATRDEYPFSPIPSIALSISTTVRYQHDQHAASGQSGPASLISNDSASCVHYKLICHAQGSKLPEPQP